VLPFPASELNRPRNRTYRENSVSGGVASPVHLDELYEYDEMNRLISTRGGNFVNGQVATCSEAFAHWGLDATGNWSTFREDEDGDGVNELDLDLTACVVDDVRSSTFLATHGGSNSGRPLPSRVYPRDLRGRPVLAVFSSYTNHRSR
jgi:hypothetical protein